MFVISYFGRFPPCKKPSRLGRPLVWWDVWLAHGPAVPTVASCRNDGGALALPGNDVPKRIDRKQATNSPLRLQKGSRAQKVLVCQILNWSLFLSLWFVPCVCICRYSIPFSWTPLCSNVLRLDLAPQDGTALDLDLCFISIIPSCCCRWHCFGWAGGNEVFSLCHLDLRVVWILGVIRDPTNQGPTEPWRGSDGWKLLFEVAILLGFLEIFCTFGMILVLFVTWSDGRREVDEKCKYPQKRWMVEVEVCGSTPFYSIEHFLEHFVRTGTTGIALSWIRRKRGGICCQNGPHPQLPTFASRFWPGFMKPIMSLSAFRSSTSCLLGWIFFGWGRELLLHSSRG